MQMNIGGKIERNRGEERSRIEFWQQVKEEVGIVTQG